MFFFVSQYHYTYVYLGFLAIVCLLKNPFLLLFNFLAVGLSPVTFILAVFSLIRIGRNRALLRGFVISILGILTSAVAFYTSIRAIGTMRPEARVMICESNMLEIGEALYQYSDKFDNRYPTPNRWCDLLREHTDVKYANEGKKLLQAILIIKMGVREQQACAKVAGDIT